MIPRTIFLLSPADSGGKRAGLLLREAARFDLARRVRTPAGAPLGEVFTFLSGLYFRGKLAYAEHFARPPRGRAGVLVITPGLGLAPPDLPVTVPVLREIAGVRIDTAEPRYRIPLEREVERLAAESGARCRFVLLGSIATGKYLDIMLARLGPRLLFPQAFVGRGDMSRGGLLLRAVAEDRELDYVPAAGAVRHGTRPPRLTGPSPKLPPRWT